MGLSKIFCLYHFPPKLEWILNIFGQWLYHPQTRTSPSEDTLRITKISELNFCQGRIHLKVWIFKRALAQVITALSPSQHSSGWLGLWLSMSSVVMSYLLWKPFLNLDKIMFPQRCPKVLLSSNYHHIASLVVLSEENNTTFNSSLG